MPSYPTDYTYESEHYFYRIPSKLGREYGYDYWNKEGSSWAGGYDEPCEPPLVGGKRNGTAFKADTGKTRWTLLLDCARGCGRAVRAVVRVLNFAVRSIAEGGKGYIPHSWREVPNARERYEDALHRHLDHIRDGETHDAESGESHWAHVATNALFLWELDNPREK